MMDLKEGLRKIAEIAVQLIGTIDGKEITAFINKSAFDVAGNISDKTSPADGAAGEVVNFDSKPDIKRSKEETMPPVYADGSFRSRAKNTIEYRFMHLGKQISVVGKSKADCFRQRTEYIKGRGKEKTERLTFGVYLLQWAERYKKNNVGAERYSQILIYINKHIMPKLGNVLLSRLTTDHLQDFLNGMPMTNTRKKVGSVLSDSLRKAYDTGKIKLNPYPGVEIKKAKSKHFEILQPADVAGFFNLVKIEKYALLFFFCCCTGLRIGEALGLHINEIDRERRVIIVNRQMKPDNSMTEILKSDAAYREVEFLPRLFEIVPIGAGPRLFESISRVGADSYLDRIKERNPHFKTLVLHSFRHTFISYLYALGVRDKQIQVWAGHSKVETTLNTYTRIVRPVCNRIFCYLSQLARAMRSILRLS